MYVPTTGTNCETTPIHNASGTAKGTPTIFSRMKKHVAEIAPSSRRE